MKPIQNRFPDARILVIDDNVENVHLVRRFLEWAGYLHIEVIKDSAMAMRTIKEFEPDIILLDLHMPPPNGYDILASLQQDHAESFIPVLVFTADGTPEAKTRALEAGASDFLPKPGDASEILLRVRNFLESRRMHLELQRYNLDLEARVRLRTEELTMARLEAVEVLANAAEFRDDDTGRHTRRVGELSASIAQDLGESEEFVEAIRLAAPLHDVGKIAVPDEILRKAGRLTDEEFATMRQHTVIGERIFGESRSPLMIMAQSIAKSHHERWDGSGYPSGLSGEDIPLAARIVSVADVYDALTSERPYKRAWSVAESVAEIRAQSGKQFDPRVVDSFLQLVNPEDLPLAA